MSEMWGHRAFLLEDFPILGLGVTTIKSWSGAMLVYVELPSYGAWEFVDIPNRYVFDICNCICLLFCNLLGEFTVVVLELVLEKPCAWANVSVCYQKHIKTYEKFPVDRGFVTEPKNIVKSIRYTYCLLF